MSKCFLVLATLFGALGVAMGAFGSHYLKSRLLPYALQVFETGVRYQFYHLFALLVAGWAIGQFQQPLFVWAGWAFVVGMVLFSGSLYLIAFTGVKSWGMVTPLGGLSLIIGWILLAVGFWRHG